MTRLDFAFPLAIGAGSRRAESPTYPAHVAQMIRQLLLTSPGERVNRPTFGCGLRQMVFASPAGGVSASVEMLVRQSLTTWLAEHVAVRTVAVDFADGTLDVRVDYELIETRTPEWVAVRIL